MMQARKTRRARVVREDIRERLLDAALVEFAAKGFDGASTRAIAGRIGAHQPQIHYHFASKEALWTAAVDRLFAELARAMRGVGSPRALSGAADVTELAAAFAEIIRRFVRFAAEHPELNRIMVHEATAESDRVRWITEQHIQPLYDTVRRLWRRLRAAGIAAPIDDRLFHYVLVGAASIVYVNAPEARLLTGIEPTAARWVVAHAEGLVATLLPNASKARPRPTPRAKRPSRRFAQRPTTTA
jgi:TetR/AcrR family transcriptional regulator